MRSAECVSHAKNVSHLSHHARLSLQEKSLLSSFWEGQMDEQRTVPHRITVVANYIDIFNYPVKGVIAGRAGLLKGPRDIPRRVAR